MKQHTLIVVPHSRAKFRKFRLSTLQVIAATAAFLVVTIGGSAALVAHFTLVVDRAELDRIQVENSALKRINGTFETSIRELEERLVGYEDKIRQLAIVADISELAPDQEAGIGGPSLPDVGGSAGIDDMRARLGELEVGYDLLHDRFTERKRLISATPAITPVKGLLTSGFGYRKDPFTSRRAHHNGLDIVAARGKPVHATGAGIVIRASTARGLGKSVEVSHGFGISTRYGHLSRIDVEPGQRIRRGDVVGAVGNSGRSTGYHLHYEVHVDGRPTNPIGYILDDINA